MKDPLSITHPELAGQWHPTKNGGLTPEQVSAGSSKKAWWICSVADDHEWEAVICSRAKLGRGCPRCAGQKPSATNSLASCYPELTKQWHTTKNGKRTPEQVVAGSGKKAWWVCPNDPSHEWETRISHRINGSGCPVCSGRQASKSNSLAIVHPEVAQQWHPAKNGTLTPEQLLPGSNKKVWWKCPENSAHEWEDVICRRVSTKKCPFCDRKKPSDTYSLAINYPEIAQEWHPTKNGKLTPDQVLPGSNKKVWWKCSKAFDHEWEAIIANRVRVQGGGCTYCAGKKPSITNNLAINYPKIAQQWHPTKNGKLTPDQVVVGSNKTVWWKCSKGSDHEWEAIIANRVKGSGCPSCSGYKPSVTNSLASCYPEIAKEWHFEKNGILAPEQVASGTSKKVWWRCSNDLSHEWEAIVVSRTKGGSGCPACHKGWTVEMIRHFISTLINHIENFTAAELYLLFQQSGLGKTDGKSKGFVKALATGRFPIKELQKFVNCEDSIVDQLLQDKQLTLESLETNINNEITDERDITSDDNLDNQINETIEPSQEEDNLNLPIVQTREVLSSLDHHVVSSADEEAVEFLIASAKAKIWKHVFHDETTAIAQAEAYTGDSYSDRVRTEFLDEYHRAKNLEIPTGYAFRIDG